MTEIASARHDGRPAAIPIRSRLRLFFSIDIVGSTDFKHARNAPAADPNSWVSPFLSFYQTSVNQIAVHWDRVVADMSAVDPTNTSGRFRFGSCPAFWKGAGDEVLFTKIVHSPLDAAAAIHAMLAVMQEHRLDQSQGRNLTIKGTAWLAGFPINNAEVILPRESATPAQGALDDLVAENYRLLDLLERDPARKADYNADYVGPSIDLGFRLCAHSTARQLIVSADLAWLLCQAHLGCRPEEHESCDYLRVPRLGYAGRVELKGIEGGEPYPLIWIEAEAATEFDRAEDRLLGSVPLADKPHHVEDLKTFCATFLNGRGPLRTRPYIADCSDAEVGRVADGHDAALRWLTAHVNGAAQQLASLPERDEEPGSGALPDALTQFAETVVSDQVAPPGHEAPRK
ncbi:MAG: hypothetical protein J0H77_04060 [Alphaproteobacteria bacterium]|nr:hypothetical protein [Alphaproteobacteria bacterium]